ncbi:hypothetical protein F5878DRAFT_666173 [Lentinula raphanica]|uniref:Uncharacterized protein n=1 Tax=Lentinula raphanica TaxID=153919 RepID=A0AA38NYB1_9AGAR|nr:hypothetical protein F5878DRAFT_666173 [Lentinula raphanica]
MLDCFNCCSPSICHNFTLLTFLMHSDSWFVVLLLKVFNGTRYSMALGILLGGRQRVDDIE